MAFSMIFSSGLRIMPTIVLGVEGVDGKGKVEVVWAVVVAAGLWTETCLIVVG